MSKRLSAAVIAAVALAAASAAPAAAHGGGGKSVTDVDGTIVDVVIAVSGADGFDRNGKDYDILRTALVATNLAGAVATTDDITVFAPNDKAFIKLARDLGYRGSKESGAVATILEATGYVDAANPGLLDDVLLYHVAPGAKTLKQLNRFGPVTTLQGGTVNVRKDRVKDADTNDKNAKARGTLRADNGTIIPVDRVLRPIDLP